MIELSLIRIDGGTQSRAELNQGTVDEYCDSYLNGNDMPPVTLFFDGSTYWLADGFHRYFGAKKALVETIYESIIPGSQDDAILYSLGANSKHGLRRSNADKRKAVQTMLKHPKWSLFSNREIAEKCAVSSTFVDQCKAVSANVCDSKVKDEVKPVTNSIKTESDDEEPEYDNTEDVISELNETVVALDFENKKLKDQLAIAGSGGTDAEKEIIAITIESLREEVRKLEIEMNAVKQSRDTYMRENGELKVQLKMQRKEIDRLKG